jgi:hypothetical protein
LSPRATEKIFATPKRSTLGIKTLARRQTQNVIFLGLTLSGSSGGRKTARNVVEALKIGFGVAKRFANPSAGRDNRKSGQRQSIQRYGQHGKCEIHP